MKIKKGDTVKMLYGKDRGRQGTVVAVDTKERKVVVEGLNIYKRHIKGDGRTRVSEIVNISRPVPISKVMLVCPECGKPTRVGYKIEDGKKERVCKKCGKVIEAQTIKEDKEEKEDKDKKEKEKKDDKKKSKSKKSKK